MKLESYNVENLFMRARAMNGDSLASGKETLAAHAQLNAILAKERYDAADKRRIVELMKILGIDKKDEARFAILRQNHGHLVKRHDGVVNVVAAGRKDWIGWVDLQVEEVDEVATRNTARVIKDTAPDVLAVIEAESRPALLRFSGNLLRAVRGKPFAHVMLIDGNDTRGIDIGIMTRAGYDIDHMSSHVDDLDGKRRIFSRDCVEYTVHTPKGERVVLLINHFKSKGYGSPKKNDDRRKRQARRVKEIYEEILETGQKDIAVLGDFNDAPTSQALAPLLQETNLQDISMHPQFDDGGRPGTYLDGMTVSKKIDYILMSPELFEKVQKGGIEREGVWAGKDGTAFPHMKQITKASEAASDHAAIWAEIDI